jgi:hypothetical protein
MHDGVGERLITINPATLNSHGPAFKNAGWGSPSEIRRTYSPPIPTGDAGLFRAPPPLSLRDRDSPLSARGYGISAA